MTERLHDLLRARSGPMTSELVRRPGDFGLGQLPSRLAPSGITRTVCGFCSTGCSLEIHLNAAGEAINLTPDRNHPVNRGMACPKGWEALTPLSAADRATHPLLRGERGAVEPVTWARALAVLVERFRAVQSKHGPAALSVLSTGQIVTEEMALLGALAKFGMGMVHIDSNTRQCMATTHAAYRESLGFDAPPFTYADFEESDALIFIGANPCIAHPIMWQRVMMNRRDPEIVVIDPRRTETAMAATLHVPLRPKSDLVLLYGLAHLLIRDGQVNRAFVEAHTDDFDAFSQFTSGFTPARVVRETGLPLTTLMSLAKIISSRERVSFWWTMGVNQGHESTRTAQAIINLALMTGQIGRPGTGANSITGQCNAMGSRLFANSTSLLGGYAFERPEDRAHVASILGIDSSRIPQEKSLAYDQILDRIDEGHIKALWVIGTNPAHSWVNQRRWRELRRKLDFLVVQDMYTSTETARMADLVLPAAGWGEKEGLFINSERRLGVTRKVARAPGEALSDFAIFRLVAKAWGCGDMFRAWSSPEATFRILRALSRGQPCDFSGVTGYDHLEQEGGIQWPFPARDHESSENAPQPADSLEPAGRERRLFGDGRFFTPNRRARFCFDEPRPMPEAPDASFPLLLNTGRGSSAQWHTGSRTNKSEVLRRLAPTSLYVEINREDARRLRISAHDRVVVRSRRGQARAFAVITATVPSGQVFMPMHFEAVNQLTAGIFDPLSRQPSYKACAVAVEAAPA